MSHVELRMAARFTPVEIGRGARVAVLVDGGGEQTVESTAELGQIDAVLRAFRAGQAGHDAVEVEIDDFAVIDIAQLGHAEHVLRFVIGLDRGDLLRLAAGGAEVVDRFFIDREEPHRCAVLGRHVGNRAAVGCRERGRAFAEEFDELAHDFRFAHEFGHGECQDRSR